jgi:predicted ester cyclase
MTESERGLGQRWFELVWNQLRRDAISEMLPPDGVLHESGVDSTGPEGFYPFFDRMNATFSELQVKVEDSIAEGDRVCVRWSCRARHTGGGLGIDPTGVTIHITGISIFRVGGNSIVEAWQNWDMLGMLEQIKGLGKSGTHVAGS